MNEGFGTEDTLGTADTETNSNLGVPPFELRLQLPITRGRPPVPGSMEIAVSGMSAGFDLLDKAAARIGRDGASGDLNGSAIDVMRASQQVRASQAVIRIADDMIGTLLDVLA
jgi:hypothetical protein